MTVATVILTVLVLAMILVLPIWPFSRSWGYGPAVFVGIILSVLLAMAATGRVPGVVVP